ncbi:MAG: trehalose-phosphatase [Nitrososphaerota archaeon]|nr:trehalose-phosphatase [Nitrososphaerota archaeon]MDG6923991.1 trehalose-phosphatase [Nitrososphaerota archaeon]
MRQKEFGSRLPSALIDERLKNRLYRSKLIIFLDYDGTLAPIVNSPSEAILPLETRMVLKDLSTLCPVSILSGRDINEVKQMVRLRNIMYAGSHGFDISGWKRRPLSKGNWDRFLPFLHLAEEKLRRELRYLPEVRVERKKFAVTVHYRKARRSDVPIMKRRFNQIASQFTLLRRTTGKQVLELLPNIDWNKGRALQYLIKVQDGKPKYLPVFIGDDLTDEEAFRVIKRNGVGILVGRTNRATYARYSLRDYVEVRSFLELVISTLRINSSRNGTSGLKRLSR